MRLSAAPLLIALVLPFVAKASVLLEQDAEAIPPLVEAVRDGEIERVKDLLRGSVDVNQRDSSGWCALTFAAVRGDVQAIELLTAAGADVNCADKFGSTPLMQAARFGEDRAVRALLKAGADVRLRDSKGDAAIDYAVQRGQKPVVELLSGNDYPEPRSGEASSRPATTNPPASMAQALDNPRAEYTEEARRRGIEGIATVYALIGTDGKVKNARVIVGLAGGLSRNAIAAVSRMHWKPATVDNRPIEMWVVVRVQFQLGHRH